MKQPSPSRRALLVFVAACAGVLAAGMAAVAAAGRFAPGREVTARAALPVRGALGAESADVLFWPEAAWEEYSLTEAARLQEGFDVDWPAGAWLDFAGWNGGAGPLPGSEWHADVPQGRCFLPATCALPPRCPARKARTGRWWPRCRRAGGTAALR